MQGRLPTRIARRIRLRPGDREGAYKYAPARNNPILNPFLRRWIEFQRANMDLKPVLSMYALVQYITKYCTNNEPSSDTLQAVTEKLLQQLARSDPEPASAASAYNHLLMSSVGSRDITAQEVAHHALPLPTLLTSATFAVATVNEREITVGGACPAAAGVASGHNRQRMRWFVMFCQEILI